MALHNYPLDRSRSHAPLSPTPQPSAQSRWVVLGAAAVVAASLLIWWWMSRARIDTAVPAPTSARDASDASHRPKTQIIDLPPLDASDDLLRQLVSTLSQHPLLARLLTTQALARSVTLAVVQIGEGRTPAAPFEKLRPTERLTIAGTESGRIDPKSYSRWDGAATALANINPDQLAQLYVNVKPLLDQAYRELGHASGDFDEALVRAINTLDETPQVPADPVLLPRPSPQHPTYYEHDDAALRALLPVQKQFLLMGPENRRKIMNWLRKLAVSLDLKIG
jgi:DUF3014 family protein